MQYIGSNIRFIFTKIKELLNSHNTDNSAHSELFKSWKRLRNPTNAEIADALAVTHKNGIGDVLVQVANTQTFALEDMKLFFRPARLQLISANESDYEGIYITMDGTQGRYVAKTFADSEIMTPEGPSTISTPSELALYPAASDAVLYTPQTLTEEQQAQARTNIGALDVNIKTTPVDIGVGLGSTVYYVKSGWLKPCPDNADKELKLQYRRVFEFIGSQVFKPNSQDILLEAKSAYALYQKGLASESIKVTKNPLNAAQAYVTWDITTRNNKHYFYYAQVSTAYNYNCTYCVEDDALTYESYQRPVYRTSNGVGEQDSANQFRMYTNPTEDMHVATKQYVDIAKTEAQQLGLTAATPGKTIKVKTVQDGKPTEWEVANIYEKPTSGIPKSDLAQSVQTSLAKADTSISYNSQTLTDAQKQQARQNIGAGQSDWNQNDETAADYVKNRPFYTGNPVETVLVEERTVSFAEYSGLYMAELTSTFEATVGETYKVYWDGAAYECNCVDFQHMPAIGNLSIVGAGSDTGEPFIMAISNGEGIAIRTADTSASHTFSISGFGTEIVKIDPKYLPDTIVTKSEVEAAQTTANAAQTTANAAQTTAENAQSTANAAQTTANAALPKTGGTMSGNLTIDTENDSFQTIISPGGMALQYVPSAGDVNDELVISGWGTPRIVAREGSDSGFKLSDMGLSLGCTSTTKDGIHLRHSNGSSSPGEIVIQHTNLNNHAKERISIASTGEIECNNRLKFNCGSEIEVVQPLGKTGGSAIILHSSTPNSTKKFKINVDDSGVPTITDKSDSTNTWKPTNLPTVTSSDSGKFLRVSDTGEWAAETILSAYEKPDTGIPKSDLEQSVQTSLAKADTSISYDSQTLTDAQKQQARTNIGAVKCSVSGNRLILTT